MQAHKHEWTYCKHTHILTQSSFHNIRVYLGSTRLWHHLIATNNPIILSFFVSIHNRGCDIDGGYALWLGVAHMLCWSLIYIQQPAAITWWWKSSLQKNSHCVDGNKSSKSNKNKQLMLLVNVPQLCFKISVFLCLEPLCHCVYPPSTPLLWQVS